MTHPELVPSAGYRHVPLYNHNGDLFSSAQLFVHLMVVNPE